MRKLHETIKQTDQMGNGTLWDSVGTVRGEQVRNLFVHVPHEIACLIHSLPGMKDSSFILHKRLRPKIGGSVAAYCPRGAKLRNTMARSFSNIGGGAICERLDSSFS
jgi:hypothetical protein